MRGRTPPHTWKSTVRGVMRETMRVKERAVIESLMGLTAVMTRDEGEDYSMRCRKVKAAAFEAVIMEVEM